MHREQEWFRAEILKQAGMALDRAKSAGVELAVLGKAGDLLACHGVTLGCWLLLVAVGVFTVCALGIVRLQAHDLERCLGGSQTLLNCSVLLHVRCPVIWYQKHCRRVRERLLDRLVVYQMRVWGRGVRIVS